MLTDIEYAMKQLKGIDLDLLREAGKYTAVDRITRALDALERLQEAAAEQQFADDLASDPNKN